MAEAEEGDVCRICRSNGDAEDPLYYPCKCTGSIKFVHDRCLKEWIEHSKKKQCDLCKHVYTFTPIYFPGMPSKIPVFQLSRHVFGLVLGLNFKIFKVIISLILFTVFLPTITYFMTTVFVSLNGKLAIGLALHPFGRQLNFHPNLPKGFNLFALYEKYLEGYKVKGIQSKLGPNLSTSFVEAYFNGVILFIFLALVFLILVYAFQFITTTFHELRNGDPLPLDGPQEDEVPKLPDTPILPMPIQAVEGSIISQTGTSDPEPSTSSTSHRTPHESLRDAPNPNKTFEQLTREKQTKYPLELPLSNYDDDGNFVPRRSSTRRGEVSRVNDKALEGIEKNSRTSMGDVAKAGGLSPSISLAQGHDLHYQKTPNSQSTILPNEQSPPIGYLIDSSDRVTRAQYNNIRASADTVPPRFTDGQGLLSGTTENSFAGSNSKTQASDRSGTPEEIPNQQQFFTGINKVRKPQVKGRLSQTPIEGTSSSQYPPRSSPDSGFMPGLSRKQTNDQNSQLIYMNEKFITTSPTSSARPVIDSEPFRIRHALAEGHRQFEMKRTGDQSKPTDSSHYTGNESDSSEDFVLKALKSRSSTEISERRRVWAPKFENLHQASSQGEVSVATSSSATLASPQQPIQVTLPQQPVQPIQPIVHPHPVAPPRQVPPPLAQPQEPAPPAPNNNPNDLANEVELLPAVFEFLMDPINVGRWAVILVFSIMVSNFFIFSALYLAGRILLLNGFFFMVTLPLYAFMKLVSLMRLFIDPVVHLIRYGVLARLLPKIFNGGATTLNPTEEGELDVLLLFLRKVCFKVLHFVPRLQAVLPATYNNVCLFLEYLHDLRMAFGSDERVVDVAVTLALGIIFLQGVFRLAVHAKLLASPDWIYKFRLNNLLVKLLIFFTYEFLAFPLPFGVLVYYLLSPVLFTHNGAPFKVPPFMGFHLLAYWGIGFFAIHFFNWGFSFLRKNTRPGFLWFIREPAAMDSAQLRLYLIRPYWKQYYLYSLFFGGYSILATLTLGVTVRNLLQVPGILPLNLYPRLSIGLWDWALRLCVVRLLFKYINRLWSPKTVLRDVGAQALKYVSAYFRLSSVVLGKRYHREEVVNRAISWSKLFRFAQPFENLEDVAQFTRCPNSDQISIFTSRKLFVRCNEDGTPLNPSEIPLDSPIYPNDKVAVVYTPPNVTFRIVHFSLVLLLLVNVVSFALFAPLLLVKPFASRVPYYEQFGDLYLYFIGLSVLTALQRVLKRAVGYSSGSESDSTEVADPLWNSMYNSIYTAEFYMNFIRLFLLMVVIPITLFLGVYNIWQVFAVQDLSMRYQLPDLVTAWVFGTTLAHFLLQFNFVGNSPMVLFLAKLYFHLKVPPVALIVFKTECIRLVSKVTLLTLSDLLVASLIALVINQPLTYSLLLQVLLLKLTLVLVWSISNWLKTNYEHWAQQVRDNLYLVDFALQNVES